MIPLGLKCQNAGYPDTLLIPEHSDFEADLQVLVKAELSRQRLLQEMKDSDLHQWDMSWPVFSELISHTNVMGTLLEERQKQYAENSKTIYDLLNRYRPEVGNYALESHIDEEKIFPIRTSRILKLRDFDFFKSKDSTRQQTFYIDHIPYKASLEIQDWRPITDAEKEWRKKDFKTLINIECNQAFDLQLSGGRRNKKNISSATFLLYRKEKNDNGHKIILPNKKICCYVKFSASLKEPFDYGFNIESDTMLDALKLSGRVRNVCVYDEEKSYQVKVKNERNTEKLFNSMAYRNVSCSECVDSAYTVTYLDDPFEGLNAKVVALTGSKIPKSVIECQDISYTIDMSMAPQLDYIFISTLEFKSDYYGHIMAGLLKWHASRGTKIKIILPGIGFLLKEKDKSLLDELQTYSPNIEVQYFKYNKLSLHFLHRVIHSKLFITISHKQAELNRVITGGRNIKDSYLFPDCTPDYSSRPDWNQYGSEEPFIYYWDLEVEVKHPEVTLQVAAQFLNIWNRDIKEHYLRASTLHLPGILNKEHESKSGLKIRHLFSIPYVDHHQMEDLYVDFIQSARFNINMVSPYFRLTKRLKTAIMDAVRRGVKVELVTRLKLSGDNAPPLSEDVNKKSVNDFYDKIAIYEWVDPNSILHVKALQIDNTLLYIGATNLNQRSFTHDIESGIVFYSTGKTAENFTTLFENVYKKRSVRITQKQKISMFSKILIPLFGGFF